MFLWIAEKLGLIGSLPWPRAWVGLILGVSSGVMLWMVTDLPLPNIALGLSIGLSTWVFLESINRPVAGFAVGIIAFWIGSGFSGVQQALQTPDVKCLHIGHLPVETCGELHRQRDEARGSPQLGRRQ